MMPDNKGGDWSSAGIGIRGFTITCRHQWNIILNIHSFGERKPYLEEGS